MLASKLKKGKQIFALACSFGGNAPLEAAALIESTIFLAHSVSTDESLPSIIQKEEIKNVSKPQYLPYIGIPDNQQNSYVVNQSLLPDIQSSSVVEEWEKIDLSSNNAGNVLVYLITFGHYLYNDVVIGLCRCQRKKLLKENE